MKDKSQIFLIIISVMLLITNLFLVFQNLGLRATLKKFEPVGVEEGDIFQPFQARDLAGNIVKLDYDKNDSKKILLFFKTTCGYCHKLMPYWKELIENIDHSKYEITVITTEDNVREINDYAKKYNVENWKILSVNSDDAQKAKLLVTPITIVLNDKGVVENVWTGMWQNKELTSVSNYFSVDLYKVKAEVGQ